jgi:hypothetical protein
VCDGEDNDCDGLVDEDGVCDDCTPTEEVCDGEDNDCDGLVDEDGVCSGPEGDGMTPIEMTGGCVCTTATPAGRTDPLALLILVVMAVACPMIARKRRV